MEPANKQLCIKCKEEFELCNAQIIFVEHGSYSAKVVTCPICSDKVSVLECEDSWLHTNGDPRMYIN